MTDMDKMMIEKVATHVMQMAEAETGVSPLHYNQLLESAKAVASAYNPDDRPIYARIEALLAKIGGEA